MNTLQRLMGFMVVRLYVCLLPLYPNHFRKTFNDEIQDIFLKIMVEAEEQGGFGFLSTSMRELNYLVVSIIKERWHELKSRKEKVMTPEENLPDTAASGGGGASSIEVVGMPGWKWIPTWVVLTTAAIPAALILMVPLAALLLLRTMASTTPDSEKRFLDCRNRRGSRLLPLASWPIIYQSG